MPDLPDVGEAVEDIGDGFTRKVGPLPVWGWAVIVVGGVTATVVIRRRFRPAGSDAGDDLDPSDPLDDLVGFPGLPARIPGPAGDGGTDGGGTGAPVAPAPTTNNEWQVLAARHLIGRGFQPTLVTDAISRFMLGRVLTKQAQALVDSAIAGIGPPPVPPPPPSVSPTPEPDGSAGGGGTKPPDKVWPEHPLPKPKPKAKAGIRCAGSGDCPQGYVCRNGRCVKR